MSRHHPSREHAKADSDHDSDELNMLPVLFLALVFILFVVPVSGTMPYANELLRFGLTAVLVSGAIIARHRRLLFSAGLITVIIAAPLCWLAMFVDHPAIFIASCVVNCGFFVAMAVVILLSVVRKHVATVSSIFGAISSYLLLGLAWAVLYWGIEHASDGAFSVARPGTAITLEGATDQVEELSQFIYFSFVTMSTLGYGDITPQTPLTQTLTWMQSVSGQFYIAVLVAWLVSEIPRQRKHAP